MNTLEILGIIFIIVQIVEAVLIYKYRYQVRRLILDVIRDQQIILPQTNYRASTIELPNYQDVDDYQEADLDHEPARSTMPCRDSRGRFTKATA